MSRYEEVASKLVGLSLSRCVRDICSGKVRLSDVVMIVSRTRIECEFDLDNVINIYKGTYWLDNPSAKISAEKCEQIARDIYSTGRLIQPRLGGRLPVFHMELVDKSQIWVGSVELFNEGTKAKKLYQDFASKLEARNNCISSGNHEWKVKHDKALKELLYALPHGSGIDGEWELDDSSTLNRLVFTCSYHHMNDGGMYDGWTDFSVVLTPTFDGFSLRIFGKFPRRYADTRDYLAEVLYHAFHRYVWWSYNSSDGKMSLHTLEN